LTGIATLGAKLPQLFGLPRAEAYRDATGQARFGHGASFYAAGLPDRNATSRGGAGRMQGIIAACAVAVFVVQLVSGRRASNSCRAAGHSVLRVARRRTSPAGSTSVAWRAGRRQRSRGSPATPRNYGWRSWRMLAGEPLEIGSGSADQRASRWPRGRGRRDVRTRGTLQKWKGSARGSEARGSSRREEFGGATRDSLLTCDYRRALINQKLLKLFGLEGLALGPLWN
jgi:hypothetical protein